MKIFGQQDDRFRYITCGVEFFIVIGVFVACGWGLDSWVDTMPLFMLIGLSLGFAGALYRLILQVKPRESDNDKNQPQNKSNND